MPDLSTTGALAALPRPTAMIFDWDNTLVDTWGVIHDAMNAALAEMGLPLWSFDEVTRNIRRSQRESFPALFAERADEATALFYKHFEARHLEALMPLPGAHSLLQRLHNAGIYLALVSNKTGKYLRAEAEALGWAPYFGRAVGALDASADKPDPVVVTEALTPSGLAAGPHVWFVGDADVDIACAHNSGCTAVLIGTTPHHPGAFDAAPPHLTVGDCASLEQIAALSFGAA